MTHLWLRPPTSWAARADELVVALLRLPADGTPDLLAADSALTLDWLLPDRALLALHGPPGRPAAALAERGWTGSRAVVRGHDRAGTGRAAAQEAVVVLRDVLGAAPDRVELWWPCAPPPPVQPAPPPAREPLW